MVYSRTHGQEKMTRILLSFVLAIVSTSLFATSPLNFTPPPGDYSMIFLYNTFGVVDGVLHGTGTQILGQLFAVFNSSIIALGGILIMYTIIVSTMNTAHEGQFLGQKWSSIWVPVRSVAGISLLIPKASGYCMMQIFVMWVVVQGVGAADKVWNAALGYLNQGGVVVQPQMDSLANPLNATSTGAHQIQAGAYTILQAQVCMHTIQKALETIRTTALKNAQQSSAGI